MVMPLISTTHIAGITLVSGTNTLTSNSTPVQIAYYLTEKTSPDGVFSVGEDVTATNDSDIFPGKFIGWHSDGDGTLVIISIFNNFYVLGSNAALGALVEKLPLQYSATDLDPTTIPCYLAGARIRTRRGEVAVEELIPGDMLQTLTGEFAPLRWIGHRAVTERRIAADPVKALPIRFAAGSLGQGLPERDLWLSPDHCLHHDGVLVQAKHLLNGTTVAQIHPARPITYYHLLMDRHEVIFAEGAESETYRPCGNVMAFANAGDFPADIELNQPRSSSRYPVKKSGPRFEALKARIAAEAEAGDCAADRSAA